MRPVAAIGAAVLLGVGARAAAAATVSVTITGAAETEYQLEVAGVTKSGRLGALEGAPAVRPVSASASAATTVRDLVDVGSRDTVVARLRFIAPDGAIISCQAVTVKVSASAAACEPVFSQAGRQPGDEGFTCESRCQPIKRQEKSRSDEDDDDDDWVYALGGPARGGRAQSYYSGSMPPSAAATLY